MPKKLTIYNSDAPELKEKSKVVDDIRDESLNSLIDDMLFTVTEHNGVGLAAPQVGVSKRIIIVASKPNSRYPYAPEEPPEAMINPEILVYSEEQEFDWEGCLSVPDTRGKVPRSKSITLSYTNRTGRQIKKNYEGFLARVIQHEVDHLNGITFVERMERGEKLVTDSEFLKQVNTSEPMAIKNE